MRDYAKISPQFWIGSTGKALRKAGAEAQIVAMYLMTSPHANMLGLYWLPELYIAAETGLTPEGASKGLRRAIEAGFCKYDEASEMVWVVEMAKYQIADRLEPADKRCKGIQKDLDTLPNNPFSKEFVELYASAFHLKKASPSEAPSKPLRSQEQEQEQEQEQDIKSPNGDLPESADSADLSACPQLEIVSRYNQTLAAKGWVAVNPKLWKGARADALRARWREDANRQSLAWWDGLFAHVQNSDWLMGKIAGRDGRPFRGDLEWLVTLRNFNKVCEGKYHD